MADGMALQTRSGATLQASQSSPETLAVAKMLQGNTRNCPDGYPFETGWTCPETFPARLRPAAEAELIVAEAQARMADKATVAKWLASLAVLVAGGRISADDAKLKLNAYADMLAGQIPAVLLNRRMLDEVARKFTFLPSYAELAREFNDPAFPIVDRPRRIRQLMALPEPAPPPRPRTPEEIREFDEKMAELKRQTGLSWGERNRRNNAPDAPT